jgi:DNA-binding GntR family transcriptional regulator
MEVLYSSNPARSLTSMAFDRLRMDILVGEFEPEERLRIQALSDRYGIGATAIREALSRLVTDGLVQSEDQRGFRVAPVSAEELRDLTQTRIRLEQTALRMAIAYGDVEWETQVLSAYHRLTRLTAPLTPELRLQWAMAHRQFHQALLAGCGSSWTLRLCNLLYDQTERYRNLAERSAEPGARDIGNEHRNLADAVMARDADAACRLLREHFERTTSILLGAGVTAERAAPRRRTAT